MNHNPNLRGIPRFSVKANCFKEDFDLALIISQDTDLLEPLRMARDEAGKTVGVMWLESNKPGKKHQAVASFIRHADRALLNRCQFPDPVVGKGGAHIVKPADW